MTQRASQTTSHVVAIISHALLRPSVSSLVRQRKLSMKAVRRAVHRRRNPCAVQPRGGGGHTAGGSAGGPRAAATDVEGSGWTAAGGAAPARGAPAATIIAAPIPEPQPPRGRRGGRPPAARAGRRRQKDGVNCWRREARYRREKHPPRCNDAGAVVAHWRRSPRRWHCRQRKVTPPRRRRVADLRAKEASKIQNAAMARVQCSHAIALTHLRRRGLVSGGRGGVAVAVSGRGFVRVIARLVAGSGLWFAGCCCCLIGGCGVPEELLAVPKKISGLRTASILIQVRFLWAAQVDFWTWAKRKNRTPARPQESYKTWAQSDF